MEEIDLKDLFVFFVKKIPFIMIITLVVFCVGMCYTLFLKTPLYESNTTLILVKKQSSSDGEQSAQTQSDIVLNQKLVSTYSEIIKSRRVLNQVIEKLDLDYTNVELSDNINVSSVSDTEIIKINVIDESNNKAQQIANTIASVFSKEVMDIYNLENVSIIDSAEVEEEPYNIQLVKEFIIYFMVGFVLACGIVFVIYYFDDSIKSSEEIESKLGIPVIGSIPRV